VVTFVAMASKNPKHHGKSDDEERTSPSELTWECQECSEDNELDPDAEEGQIVECTECGTEFEIVRTRPLSLSPLGGGDDDDGDGDWEE
jgi:lysine biosynthesis protein LysW